MKKLKNIYSENYSKSLSMYNINSKVYYGLNLHFKMCKYIRSKKDLLFKHYK